MNLRGKPIDWIPPRYFENFECDCEKEVSDEQLEEMCLQYLFNKK